MAQSGASDQSLIDDQKGDMMWRNVGRLIVRLNCDRRSSLKGMRYVA